MFTYAVDDQTVLRLLERRHAPALYALTNSCRPHLRRWLPWVDATRSVDDTMRFIEHGLEQFAAGDGFHVGVWYRGALAGVAGYHGIDHANEKTSLGYWLGEPYQGRGLMTRACAALVDNAFGTFGLHRVEIRCATENLRSRAIPERLGFELEGTLREVEALYGRRVDHAVYGMLATQWRRDR